MTERLTNLASSTLAAPISTTGAITPTVTNAAKFPSAGDFRIRIDSEHMLVTARSGNVLTISAGNRGIEGTTAASHLSGVAVRHVLTTVGLDTRVTETVQTTMRGVASATNGLAPLDGTGKIPSTYLPASAVELKGTWDASVASFGNPALHDNTGTLGDEYVVSVGGTRDLGSGSITWAANDIALHNGTIWQQVAGAGGVAGVTSVAGLSGVVLADALTTALALVIADVTGLQTALNAKADDTDLAAKADDTDLTIVGPRKSLNTLGTPYLISTDTGGADIGCVFDTASTTARTVRIPLAAARNYTEKSWFVIANTGNSLTATCRVEMNGGSLNIKTPLSVGTLVDHVMVMPNGCCQFTKQVAGSDIWMANGDHTLT